MVMLIVTFPSVRPDCVRLNDGSGIVIAPNVSSIRSSVASVSVSMLSLIPFAMPSTYISPIQIPFLDGDLMPSHEHAASKAASAASTAASTIHPAALVIPFAIP